MAEWWEEKGQEVYRVLGECIEHALEDENSEMATMCGIALAKFAEAEGANYFGYEGPYNFNRAINLVREALELAEKEGVPRWLEDELEELKKIVEGWK